MRAVPDQPAAPAIPDSVIDAVRHQLRSARERLASHEACLARHQKRVEEEQGCVAAALAERRELAMFLAAHDIFTEESEVA